MNWLNRLMQRTKAASAGSPAHAWPLLAAQARSSNGFEREAAVVTLAASKQGAALPLLLERVNDWVPEVRQLARAGVDAFIAPELGSSWVRALDAVIALARARRIDHAAMLERIERFLTQPALLEMLAAFEPHMSATARGYALRLGLRAQDPATRRAAFHRALASRDIRAATLAAREIGMETEPAARLELAATACGSGFAAVRLQGLRIAAAASGDAAHTLVRRMHVDRSASVRTFAFATATADERTRILLHTAGLLERGPAGVRAAALEMLCKLEPVLADERLDAAMTHASPAVRRMACALVLGRIDHDARDAFVERMLDDASPRVRSLAVAQVHKGAGAPAASALLAGCLRRPDTVASRLAVATRLAPWDHLKLLLELPVAMPGHPCVTRDTLLELARWSPGAVGVRASEAASIRAAWQACTPLLDSSEAAGARANALQHLTWSGVLDATCHALSGPLHASGDKRLPPQSTIHPGETTP